MPLPTTNDVQAVDPVLTNMLVGYQQSDDRFVANRVFPAVSVDKDSGTYYIMTKKYWFLDQLEQRAAGGKFAQTGFGVETSTYTTLQWGIEEALADETRANSQVPMDLESVAARHIANMSLIRKERAFGTDFMATSVWGTDNTSATDWDDFQAGDPVTDCLTARRTISDATGQEANSIVIGSIVDQALVNHPDILDRMKYTQAATMGNIRAVLANVLGFTNYFVSRASYNSANEASAMTAAAIIDDDALVCFVDSGAGLFGASAGKTFVWQPGGGLGQISQYRDQSRKSDILQHSEQWDQKAVATDLGYFFSDIV